MSDPTTDRVGDTWVPLIAPNSNEAVTDPLLTYFLSFFKAIANAYTPAAWQAICPNTFPVTTTFAHNPEEVYFDDRDLAALYLWRDEQLDQVDLANDIQMTSYNLKLLWIPQQIADQDGRRLRRPFIQGLFKALNVYFERGRDPAWYVPGDDYPARTADPVVNRQVCASLGSVLAHWAPYRRAILQKWKGVKVQLRMTEAGEFRTYEAYEAVIYLEEQLIRDLTRFDELLGLDQKINVGADPNDPITFPAYTIVEKIEPAP